MYNSIESWPKINHFPTLYIAHVYRSVSINIRITISIRNNLWWTLSSKRLLRYVGRLNQFFYLNCYTKDIQQFSCTVLWKWKVIAKWKTANWSVSLRFVSVDNKIVYYVWGKINYMPIFTVVILKKRQRIDSLVTLIKNLNLTLYWR